MSYVFMDLIQCFSLKPSLLEHLIPLSKEVVLA